MEKVLLANHSKQLLDKKTRLQGRFKDILRQEGLENKKNNKDLEKFIDSVLQIN